MTEAAARGRTGTGRVENGARKPGKQHWRLQGAARLLYRLQPNWEGRCEGSGAGLAWLRGLGQGSGWEPGGCTEGTGDSGERLHQEDTQLLPAGCSEKSNPQRVLNASAAHREREAGGDNLTRCQQSHAPGDPAPSDPAPSPWPIPGLAPLPPDPVGVPQTEPGSPLGSSAADGPRFHPGSGRRDHLW